MDEKRNPKIESDPAKWADWMEKRDNTGIAFDWFESNGSPSLYVSTEFTGEDRNLLAQGNPILFETLVYDDDGMWDHLTKRYATKVEALAGHAEIMKYLSTDENRIGALRKSALDGYLEGARGMAEKIAVMPSKKFSSAKDFPEVGGVYLIYDQDKEVIYVGKARNLRRRICIDHLSAEASDTMSSFRRSINALYDIPYGLDMRNWIVEGCSFAWLEVEDPDMRSLLEALLIRCLRGSNLLNKA